MGLDSLEPRAKPRGLVCLYCGARFGLDPLFAGCPKCQAEHFRANLTVELDYTPLQGKMNRESFRNSLPGIWRFARLLPTEHPKHFVSIHEGNTPLVPLPQVARAAGLKNILAKDETRNPTLSYKDRLCAVATAKALELGARATTMSSTGNHGASTAAYASRAGLDCFLFTVSYTSQSMITLMAVYGAKLVATPTFQDRWTLMGEGVRRYGWMPTGNFTIPPTGNPYGVEGYKTLAFELVEQMGWEVPDYVVVPTGFGEGLYGTWKGFKEFQALGLTGSLPRMVSSAPLGCDPLREAMEKKLERAPILPQKKTVALSIGVFTTGHQGLVALRESRGEAVSLTDEEILEGQRILALDGIFAEAASATSVAAAIQLGQGRKIDPEATVVCVITASGLKMVDDARRYLPEVPVVPPDFEEYRKTIERVYQVHLE